jgi:hypothetical protein
MPDEKTIHFTNQEFEEYLIAFQRIVFADCISEPALRDLNEKYGIPPYLAPAEHA